MCKKNGFPRRFGRMGARGLQERPAFALFWAVFYRTLVVGIIAFWLGMTCLLVRLEWSPRNTDALEVPTAYLWKLMFLHEEASDLVVYHQHQRIGNLHLQPHRLPSETDGAESGTRQLSAVGGFSTDLPWIGRQNVVLHGSVDLGATNEVRALRLSAVFHPPGLPHNAGTTVQLDGHPASGVWHYSAQRGDETLAEDTGTVAHLLDRPELRAMGIDPASFARLQQQQAGGLTVTARHGRLRLNRDEIETYVVTLKDANGLEASVHLNQLGQILAVRTFAGVDLLDGALNP